MATEKMMPQSLVERLTLIACAMGRHIWFISKTFECGNITTGMEKTRDA
ncbi:hypothetical protein BH09BAC1_BH09BAC1_06830 [soil metagenome]